MDFVPYRPSAPSTHQHLIAGVKWNEMIKNKKIAKEVSDLMLSIGDKLDGSVALVKEECDQEDFKKYRLAVGKVLGEMLLEIMNPIYDEHPDIKPVELK